MTGNQFCASGISSESTLEVVSNRAYPNEIGMAQNWATGASKANSAAQVSRPIFGLRTARTRCQLAHNRDSWVPSPIPRKSAEKSVQGTGSVGLSVCNLCAFGSVLRSKNRTYPPTSTAMIVPMMIARRNVRLASVNVAGKIDQPGPIMKQLILRATRRRQARSALSRVIPRKFAS